MKSIKAYCQKYGPEKIDGQGAWYVCPYECFRFGVCVRTADVEPCVTPNE